MADNVLLMSLDELSGRYQKGTLSPVEVARAHLARLAKLEPVLNAFQIVDEAGALAAARASEARWRSGAALGKLDGAPATIKDNVDLMGFPTRSGSTTTPAAAAAADAPVVARLREAGAVFLGKTTTPEFGWKGITDSSLRGAATRNPWQPAHSSGGSSGGAAAAVVAGIGTIAFGNDGGGSIRIPAAFCGAFGIKPSFGRVPHHPLESPFATVVAGGPITRTVQDAATTLAVMARPDERDWYSIPPPRSGWLADLAPKVSGVRFAWSPDLGGAKPDAEVMAVLAPALAVLRRAGAAVESVGPVIDPLKPVFTDFWLAGWLCQPVARDPGGPLGGNRSRLAGPGEAGAGDRRGPGERRPGGAPATAQPGGRAVPNPPSAADPGHPACGAAGRHCLSQPGL
ncbi:MAG: hypothetical protein IT555_07110 [Acetobacteraceae bacterium]|nr:hypothetical protein [Acetobacteraceae bacterium]